MKIVVFGLTVSSSWGNGHATLWRGLIRALFRRSHRVVFFERERAYYSGWHRDLHELPDGELVFYSDWERVRARAEAELRDADVGMVTSYCPDGPGAAAQVQNSNASVKVFYDLDTPVTLQSLSRGEAVAYLPPEGLGGFDLVLSYTGGRALDQLRTRLGARRVAPLYGHVDPQVHRPVAPVEEYRADLSYLGTFAEDRQRALESLLVEPARRRAGRRFVIGGAQYPQDFPWAANIYFVRHLSPNQHPAFYCSGRLTLNITRRAMAEFGHCPSGRLFEAAACGGAAILTDSWEGLDEFFEPGREVIVAGNTEEAIAATELSDAELREVAGAARERVLRFHTSDQRAKDFEDAVEQALVTAGDA